MPMLKKDVTIVGAGHYARNLIGPKYLKSQYAQLKAVLSPSVSEETVLRSALSGVPLFRNSSEWVETNGVATIDDVFDLCVHASQHSDNSR